MVSFRKMLWAFALVAAFAAIAGAQALVYPPFQCQVNTGVPPILRAESLADETGQIVIVCTGGTPTLIGQIVPTVNVQLFLNTQITSKILSDPWLESLLLIDEPQPANQLVCGDSGTSFDTGSGTCIVRAASSIGVGPAGNPWGIPGTYDGATVGEDIYHKSGHPNIFQARCTASSCASSNPYSVVWLGVPVDPPGTSGQRVIRLANVRANSSANSLSSISGFLPQSVYAVISISGTGSLPVSNQALTVGIVQPGMTFSVLGSPSFLQCQPQEGTCPNFALRFQENFGTAFRRVSTAGSGTTPNRALYFPIGGTGVDVQQNIPGSVYNTEGMFYGTNLPDLSAIGRGKLGDTVAGAGRATQGTRLIARFANIPLNVTLYVTQYNLNPILETSSGVTGGALAANVAEITSTNSDGSGKFKVPDFDSWPKTGDNGYGPCSLKGVHGAAVEDDTNSYPGITGNQLYQIGLTSNGTTNSGEVVWEVLDANPGQITSMDFGVVVNYGSSPLPNLGSGTVSGNYAPLSTVATFSSSAPFPRFIDNPQNSATFSINPCKTDLLYPFVSHQSGFDTGYIVANTSASPFEAQAPRQTGKCTYYYYGTFPDPTKTTAQQTTTVNVDPGTLAIATLSGGGDHGLGPMAGFQGYMIVICNFQFAHGFAYISPFGAPLSGGATGYVALVMDDDLYLDPDSILHTRTQTQSEPLRH